MIKAIKVRLYPNQASQKMLDDHFNACRYVYNLGLEYKVKLYKDYGIQTSKYDLVNQLPDVKKEATWLNEIKAECLQTSFDNLEVAFLTFYKGGGFPKFKSKRNKQSFVQKQTIDINESRIKFYKHLISFKCSSRDKILLQTEKFKKITYSKDNLNQYWASILIETEHLKNKDFQESAIKEIGIDLGISNFLVTSDNQFIENPKFLKKSNKKLKKIQRKHSKCLKGSKNKEKLRIRVAKLYKKISNQRNHFHHQVSNKLINENQVIAIETLNVKGMMKNRKLAHSISDASWSTFVQMLLTKAKWNRRTVNRISRWSPSSKTCSSCGSVNQELTLKDRVFKCSCGHIQDRDLNAAENILNFSRDESTRINASGE